MKVIIIQRIFPIYRKAIFDKLNKAYGIELFHGKNTSGISQVNTLYSKQIKLFQPFKKETIALLFGFRKIIKSKPDIIFHEFTIGVPTLLVVRMLAYIMRSKFIIWGHNINLERGFKPFSSFSDFYRYLIMKSSDAILFYIPDQMEHVKKYINNEKMFVAYNALDTETQLKNYQKISAIKREDIKNELHINAKYNLIFISRLLPAKKPEQIIEMYGMLEEKIRNNVGVHIIGNGTMYEPLKKMIEEFGYSNNIKLYGEITDENQLGRLLYVSDFMVNPGYLGLSVNLAFAYGCPIITFENEKMEQVHSPEIYYLKDGYSGIKIKNLDLEEMAESLSRTLVDGSYLEMRKNCLKTIYTEGSIDQMFGGFEKAISFVNK
jgi:glycosyltransferase involved in cell wall biosynthesis